MSARILFLKVLCKRVQLVLTYLWLTFVFSWDILTWKGCRLSHIIVDAYYRYILCILQYKLHLLFFLFLLKFEVGQTYPSLDIATTSGGFQAPIAKALHREAQKILLHHWIIVGILSTVFFQLVNVGAQRYWPTLVIRTSKTLLCTGSQKRWEFIVDW